MVSKRHEQGKSNPARRRKSTTSTPPTTPPASSADPASNHAGNGQATTPDAAPNPFKPEALRLAAKYTPDTSRAAQTTIKVVGRPDKEVYFRTHPGKEYTVPAVLIEYEKKLYLVDPKYADELRDHEAAKVCLLRLCITRQGNLFIWALRVSTKAKDGQLDSYARTSLEIADQATHTWLKVLTDQPNGVYVAKPAENQEGEPAWTEVTMEDCLRAGFRHQLIDHPVDNDIMRRLRGAKT
jgi:hypothetical protein